MQFDVKLYSSVIFIHGVSHGRRHIADTHKMKKNIHTQQSSSGQVPTCYINITVIIIQKNFCST